MVEIRDGAIVCEGRVPASSLLAGASTTPALGIELAAQTAAVLGALERAGVAEVAEVADRSDEATRIGYLAAIRSARFHAPAIPAGEPLRARVRRTGAMAGLTIYNAEVETAAGETLLTASFSTMLVDQPGSTSPSPSTSGQSARKQNH